MKNSNYMKECDVANFDAFVEKSKHEYVLFYFNASWCGPCRMIKPLLYRLAEKFEDKLTIASINVEENMILARNFDIASIPALILYKNGVLCESCSLNRFNINSISLLEKELAS